MNQHRRRSPVLFIGALLVASALLAALPLHDRLRAIAAEALPGGEPMTIYSRAIPLFPDDPDRTKVGKLTYLGGIVISSPDPRFGGYSGLLIDKQGARFLAQSDRAYWFAGDIIDKGGRLAGLKNAVLAPMLDADGKQLTAPRFDSESIAAVNGFPGDVLVGFESVDRVDRYAIGREGYLARPTPVTMPQDIKNNVPNKGLEGIALLDDGQLLAIAERTLDDQGNEKGWLVPLDGAGASTLSLKRTDPYDLTDLTRLANGDILTLERRYTEIAGPGMRIRLIKKATIVPGAVLDGEVLAELGAGTSVDNMEGLANRTAEDGRTLIYVISDDNQAATQHTVLFEFVLNDTP